MTQKLKFVLGRVEKIVGKGEKAIFLTNSQIIKTSGLCGKVLKSIFLELFPQYFPFQRKFLPYEKKRNIFFTNISHLKESLIVFW